MKDNQFTLTYKQAVAQAMLGIELRVAVLVHYAYDYIIYELLGSFLAHQLAHLSALQQ